MSFLGLHTVDEVQDLIDAKDYENAQMAAAWDTLSPTTRQGADALSWSNDWGTYLARYSAARAAGENTITLAQKTGQSPSTTIAEEIFEGLVRAEKANPQGTYAPTDKMGLYTRLLTFRGGQKVDFKDMPQPAPGKDFDLNAYLLADAAVRVIEHGAAATKDAASWAGMNVLLPLGAVLALALVLDLGRSRR